MFWCRYLVDDKSSEVWNDCYLFMNGGRKKHELICLQVDINEEVDGVYSKSDGVRILLKRNTE